MEVDGVGIFGLSGENVESLGRLRWLRIAERAFSIRPSLSSAASKRS